MNHLSIACKHPIPNWRERTESLSVPYRGRSYSSKQNNRLGMSILKKNMMGSNMITVALITHPSNPFIP
ncbi:hypothetical protein LSH36_100g06040 [Paralvinella palmiformis]|uniref:Uncharacterized protein n=1 Tax=Paralvinella palmiformis TaxID=53620 RepID=A0AAD9NBR0_9ANNE|nr:hypothetical protein LSH36_100g06040 [Paralvinella palmiformis]